MSDFETMPVGTAALLRDVARMLRVDHGKQAALYDEATEKVRCANGRAQEEAFRTDQLAAATQAERLATMIGRVEALLDRSHAAAGAVG